MENKNFKTYLARIKQLPLKQTGKYQKSELLTQDFLLAEKRDLQIYFAPHNLVVNTQAKIVIVGICPGWTQTEIAFRTYRQNLFLQSNERLILCKQASRFAGRMRKNLVEMLDQLQLNQWLKIESSASLFTAENVDLHTTSLLKFPVFKKGCNYPGYGPKILKSELLTEYMTHYFLSEMSELVQPVLIIPLGKAVEEVLLTLHVRGQLNKQTILTGFPHPSGVNGHRKEQFSTNYQSLKQQLGMFFKDEH